MYFLLKMVIFQPAILVYQEVSQYLRSVLNIPSGWPEDFFHNQWRLVVYPIIYLHILSPSHMGEDQPPESRQEADAFTGAFQTQHKGTEQMYQITTCTWGFRLEKTPRDPITECRLMSKGWTQSPKQNA